MSGSTATAIKVLGIGAIGVVAWLWFSTVYAIASFVFKFKTVKVHSIRWNGLLPELQLKFIALVTNTTSQPIEVSFVNAQVDIDGKNVGSAVHKIGVRMDRQYQSEEISMLFDVSIVPLGATVIEALTKGNYSGHTIGIKGFINVNGFDFDFDEKIQLSA